MHSPDKKAIVKRYKELGHLSKEIKEELGKEKPESQALEKLFNELYLYATRDHLTGVFNRRILDELLSKEMERAIRENLPLCVIILDIDDFKHYNDTFGHLQGDAALRTITKVVQRMTRKQYFVARYGGEEFIIVLPDTDLSEAKKIAEHIRKRISETIIHPVHKHIEKGYEHVTISMGIAKLVKHDIQHVLQMADNALYKAKAQGKNKVVIANH